MMVNSWKWKYSGSPFFSWKQGKDILANLWGMSSSKFKPLQIVTGWGAVFFAYMRNCAWKPGGHGVYYALAVGAGNDAGHPSRDFGLTSKVAWPLVDHSCFIQFKNNAKQRKKTRTHEACACGCNHLKIRAKKMEPTLGIEPRTCSLRGIMFTKNNSLITNEI